MLLPDKSVGNGRVCPDNVTANTGPGDKDADTVVCRGIGDNRNGLFQGLIHFGRAGYVHFQHARAVIVPAMGWAGGTRR